MQCILGLCNRCVGTVWPTLCEANPVVVKHDRFPAFPVLESTKKVPKNRLVNQAPLAARRQRPRPMNAAVERLSVTA